jgi:hypothetical protein
MKMVVVTKNGWPKFPIQNMSWKNMIPQGKYAQVPQGNIVA